MKILMLSTKLYHEDGSPWLISELAEELSRTGNDVFVINLEWSQYAVTNIFNNKFRSLYFTAFHLKIPLLSVAFRWLFSSLKLIPSLIKAIINKEKFDLLITFSPCTALYSAIPLAHVLCKKSFLVYWDFFPTHNQEISKKSPKSLLPILKFIEQKLVHSFDRVGCMSPANILFYKNYFGITPRQSIEIIPVWTSVTDYNSSNKINIRETLQINHESIVVVFGGQLVHGRGVVELCHAIIDANKIDNRIVLIICGSGILLKELKLLENENPDIIKLLGFVERKRYLEILCASDIGVVSTVAGVSSPSYPSKSLDYMACGLPILAAIEAASDFGEIAEANHFGVSCPANDLSAMIDALIRLSFNENLRHELGENGKKYLDSTHNVSNIVRLITEQNI